MSGEFCARVSCGEHASAVLLINARELSAHVVDIQEEANIGGVRLCRVHADAVAVPLGWTQTDNRSPAAEQVEFEPELVLVEDAPSNSSGYPGALRLPEVAEAEEEDMEDAAVGEVPPLLSRAFRAAGLD